MTEEFYAEYDRAVKQFFKASGGSIAEKAAMYAYQGMQRQMPLGVSRDNRMEAIFWKWRAAFRDGSIHND